MELKSHPELGACGLDCGLCPRFNSSGAAPCRGCGGAGFWEKGYHCSVAACALRTHMLETCGQCPELADCPKMAKRLDVASRRDSLLSYRPVPANLALVRERGLDALVSLEARKQGMLKILLADYNDRSKGFYCLACQLLPAEEMETMLKEVKRQATLGAGLKQRAADMRRAIEATAASLGIRLELRTKQSVGV